MIAPYPQFEQGLEDDAAEAEIKLMQEMLSVTRSMRDSYGLKPSMKPVVYFKCRKHLAAIQSEAENLKTLARCETVTVVGDDGEIAKGCGASFVSLWMCVPEGLQCILCLSVIFVPEGLRCVSCLCVYVCICLARIAGRWATSRSGAWAWQR